jgi:hypothetical protein
MSKQDVFAAQAAFDSALATYEAFRAKNNDLIEEHDYLALALNESLEVLKTQLRGNYELVGKQFAGFKISVPKKYNYDALKAAIGDAQAEGYAVVKYSVDSKKFEEAIAKRMFSKDILEEVISDDTPRITGGPKPPSIFQR